MEKDTPKLFDTNEHHCYGCGDFIYDITKPLVKGYCPYLDKDIEVVFHNGSFMHKRLEECYGKNHLTASQKI